MTDTKTTDRHQVIEGPSSNWAALTEYEGRDALILLPMDADGGRFDEQHPPKHPDAGGSYDDGWYDYDPRSAEDADDEAEVASVVARLKEVK